MRFYYECSLCNHTCVAIALLFLNVHRQETSVDLSPHLCPVRKTDLCPAFIHDKPLTLHTHGSTQTVPPPPPPLLFLCSETHSET